jgi:hypothetical protein
MLTIELGRLFRKARGSESLKPFKLSEDGAETLMRTQARGVFKPSQFYVSYESYESHIVKRGWDDHNGGLTAEGEVALALYCMKNAAMGYFTFGEIEPHNHADVLRAYDSDVTMEILHAYLSRGTLTLHRLAYTLIGSQQERLPFLPKAAWYWAKDGLSKVAQEGDQERDHKGGR